MDPKVALYLWKLKEVSMDPGEFTETKLRVLQKILEMQLSKSADSSNRTRKKPQISATTTM